MSLHFPRRERRVVDREGAWTSRWLSFFSDVAQFFGTWEQVPHVAGSFTANGAMTWTVASGDQTTLALLRMGQLAVLSFALTATSVGGVVNTTLKIALPAGLSAARAMSAPVWISDNGTPAIGVARVAAAGTVVEIQKVDGSNWTASANATKVEGQLWFEVG